MQRNLRSVNGKLNLTKTNVTYELSDLSSSGSTDIFVNDKYLPEKTNLDIDNLFSLNINFSFVDPIRITNSFLDLNLAGDLLLVGTENNPLLNGEIKLVNQQNKVTFKNNDFVIKRGIIAFSQGEKISNPDIDFSFILSRAINERWIPIAFSISPLLLNRPPNAK